jgi:hypothetical protein
VNALDYGVTFVFVSVTPTICISRLNVTGTYFIISLYAVFWYSVPPYGCGM